MLPRISKYKTMLISGFLFFYLGCGITLTFIKMECAEAQKANPAVTMSTTGFSGVEFVVLILSSPENVARRDAIRATWMKFSNNIIIDNGEKVYKWNHTWAITQTDSEFIKFLFVVGTKELDPKVLSNLEKENRTSKDLLLLHSFEDTYKNLAIKMLHSLKWIGDNMKDLKYLIKCDDDSFLRIDLIIKDLEAFAPDMNAPVLRNYVSFKEGQFPYTGLYWGYFDGRAKVYLNGKWQEKNWFLCDNYLPYTLGGGYVISRNIVQYISRNNDVLSHYNSEDVSMGVWTASLGGINRVHDIRFDTEWKSRGCSNDLLVRHKQTTKDLFDMYRTLVHSKGDKTCKTEYLDRNYYRYKWNVLPSSCCK